MYISATRSVNLGLPKAFIQLLCMQTCILLMYKPGVTYFFKLGFAIFMTSCPTVQQLVPVIASNFKDFKPDVQSQLSM